MMTKKIERKQAINQIKIVDFGAPAAERDVNRGLKEYFLYTGAFNRLKKQQKSVILGNRGAGKSALIKMLAEDYKKNGSIVVELTPEDYSYDLLKSAVLGEKDELWAKQSAYTAAWKFLLYVLAMKQYSNEFKTVLKTNANGVYHYLRDNFKTDHLDKIDIFISYLKRIDGIKIGPYEAGLKIKELHKLYKLEEITRLLPELIQLSTRKPIIILIDELDKGWDSSEDAKAFVAALFQAGISINELGPNIRVVISLRKELYDDIPSLYDDFQKYYDLFEVLEWDEESLFDLIIKRIKHSVPELKNYPKAQTWSSIFADSIDKESSFQYIVNRTLYRPREIIQFCTEAKDRCIELRKGKIDINSIVTAEAKYSQTRSKDLAAEHRFQYPGLLDVFEAFRGSKCEWKRRDLEQVCHKMIKGEISTGQKTEWLKSQNEDYLINILFQVGFLQAKTISYNDAKRIEGFWGNHQISLPNLGNVQLFLIHPMFWLHLGISGTNETHNEFI
jgi:energy-coupling factor transporter ATP-binding protein EcfA2